MERLVQQSDLDKYPELKSKGVSVNQHFDFDAMPQQTNETPPVAEKKSKVKETMIPEEPKKTTNGKGKK